MDLTVLPIDEVIMPAEDVSDLKDVVDAINRLCETMKASDYEEHKPTAPTYVECEVELVKPEEVTVRRVEINRAETWDERASSSSREIEVSMEAWSDTQSYPPTRNVEGEDIWAAPPSSEEVSIRRVDRDRWSDCRLSPPATVEDIAIMTSDAEPTTVQCEPISEMYYTASSEVSLLSDSELPDRVQYEEDSDKDDRKECVIAGHVAAMRERFESMTRTNTPCPDLIRSTSPSLDVFRNITPSPDDLG